MRRVWCLGPEAQISAPGAGDVLDPLLEATYDPSGLEGDGPSSLEGRSR